jgi:ribonuclease J
VPDDLLVKPRRLDEFMPHETLIICTGSQGEPRSALTRIAFGDHPAVQINSSDTVVVSARAIPGNEVKVHETVNRLCRLGATVLTEDTTYVNASGHAAADDLSTMIETVRPRAFMPIHGEYRMLQAHVRLAEKAGVPAHATRIAENGTVLELDGDGLSVVGQVEAGTTLVDGMNVGSVRDVVLRDRRHLASDGVLIVVATIAADSAEPIAEPEIIARGFIEPSDDGNILLDQAREAVERVLRECQAHRTTEVHLVQQELHDALAELVSNETGKRPMVLPVVVEV